MQKIYTVQALGWGDSEDEFYNIGQYSTREKAEKRIAELEAEWLADNGDMLGCELKIEEWELDA
jgi:hypothetical protein